MTFIQSQRVNTTEILWAQWQTFPDVPTSAGELVLRGCTRFPRELHAFIRCAFFQLPNRKFSRCWSWTASCSSAPQAVPFWSATACRYSSTPSYGATNRCSTACCRWRRHRGRGTWAPRSPRGKNTLGSCWLVGRAIAVYALAEQRMGLVAAWVILPPGNAKSRSFLYGLRTKERQANERIELTLITEWGLTDYVRRVVGSFDVGGDIKELKDIPHSEVGTSELSLSLYIYMER